MNEQQKEAFKRLKTSEFVSQWMDEIALGEAYKKKTSDVSEWYLYRQWYRGDWGDEVTNYKRTIVNRVFSYIRSALPRIYFKTPSIAVTPRLPDYSAHARVVEAVDSWLVYETNLKKQMKLAVFDALLCGTGFIKLGYDSEFGYLPIQGVAQDSGTATQIGVKSANQIETHQNVSPGMPWGLRVRPDDIITPYGYSEIEAMPWICHRFLRPVRDVWEDQKYDATARALVKGGFSVPKNQNAIAIKNVQNEDYACIYEIRDKRTHRLITICEDQLLIDADDALQIDGLPFEAIIFNEDPENFWGISDVRMIRPQIEELNEIRTQASLNRRYSLLKFAYLKGALTAENLDRLLSCDPEDIAAGIEVQGDSISTAMTTLQPSNLTNDLLREQDRTENDMRDTIGFSLNQLGEFTPQHNKTATETEAVSEGSSIRSDDRRDVAADCLSNVLRKWNQYIFKYWETERVVEIAGPQGAKEWIKYTGAQLRGEYQLVINPETGQPVSRALRQRVAEAMYKLFNNDPLIDQIQLRRLVLQQTDLIDPAYQNLVRVPAQAPQSPGEMPGMPGIPAAGQAVSHSTLPGNAQPGPAQAPPPPIDLNKLMQLRMKNEQDTDRHQADLQHKMLTQDKEHNHEMDKEQMMALMNMMMQHMSNEEGGED
jgi:hypothetical protein